MMSKRVSFSALGTRIFLGVLVSGFLYAVLWYSWTYHDTSEKSIIVYAYSDMLSAQVFKPFEERTGVRVIVKHFESIEEVMTKLAFAADESIDIVAPSDSMIEILSKDKRIIALNKHELSYFHQVDVAFLDRFFDPANTYSVPFAWSPVGVGYDSRVLPLSPDQIKWDIIWGRLEKGVLIPPSKIYGDVVQKVCVGEDPWEALFIVATHLYGRCDNLTEQQLEEIAFVLRSQKEWLESYTNNLRYFLIAGVAPAVVIPAAYMIMMHEQYPWAKFALPQRGSVLYIGHLAITKGCRDKNLAHQVIDFLISPEGGERLFDEHAYYSTNTKTYADLFQRVRADKHLFPSGSRLKTLEIFHNQIPLARVEQLWHQVKC